MKLKLTVLAAVFTAGMTASIALAHGPGDGKGKEHAFGKNGCHPVHVRGTVAPQTLTVTSTDKTGATKSTVVQFGGATGTTVRIDALACQTTGTTTSAVLQGKAAFLAVRTPRPPHTTTTSTATTATTTTATGTTSTVTTSFTHHSRHHKG